MLKIVALIDIKINKNYYCVKLLHSLVRSESKKM